PQQATGAKRIPWQRLHFPGPCRLIGPEHCSHLHREESAMVVNRMLLWCRWLLILLAAGLTPTLARSQNPAGETKAKKAAQKMQEVAGSAEFLRSLPKHFATLTAVDLANHRVTLLIEGDHLPKVWPLTPDAEIKVAGWWGRLDQLTIGDRVWAWFKTDRK